MMGKITKKKMGTSQKKSNKDPRVTKTFFSLKNFLLIFIITATISGGNILAVFAMLSSNDPKYKTISAMVGYLLLMSLVECLVIFAIQRITYYTPLKNLADAARQIASGDFSVQVMTENNGKKKDNLQVFIDDFNTMALQLSSIETLKDDFIGNVSHEIKTPLAIIQNYATILQSDTLTQEEKKEYSQTIIEASQKLSTLITNILKLNKLENQEIISSANWYDLSEQLRECAVSFEELWEKKNITFWVDIEDECLVYYDKQMMEIIWNNLFSNAIKYTPQNGSIRITEKSEEGIITITVADSGCGIDSRTAKHIFEKFYQGDTSHAQEGNGLGLAMVKRIITLVGGEVSVQSKIDIGTTFTVVLKQKDKQV